MAAKISDVMFNELRYAATQGYQGEMVYAGRKTEDALRRRGLITNDYDDTTFAAKARGYRNPVLTVAGWAASGVTRPADDPGRYSLEEAWNEAHANNDKENNDVTIKEGPLTERQVRIIGYLREGKRHAEIVDHLPDTTVNVVKQECQNIAAKFNARTVTQACALWATAQAYREAAALLEASAQEENHGGRFPDILKVNEVLFGLAAILRERADRLTPQ